MLSQWRVLAGAAGAVLLALGSQARADAQLTFRYAYDNVDEIRAGLDQFEKDNPGIKVDLERIAFKDARGYGHNDFKIPLGRNTVAKGLLDAAALDLAEEAQ